MNFLAVLKAEITAIETRLLAYLPQGRDHIQVAIADAHKNIDDYIDQAHISVKQTVTAEDTALRAASPETAAQTGADLSASTASDQAADPELGTQGELDLDRVDIPHVQD